MAKAKNVGQQDRGALREDGRLMISLRSGHEIDTVRSRLYR
mgnify:CR=1 FL=1